MLQAADILAYRAHAVPVGEDQLPHLELTREMARRFNRFFGELFPEPEGLVTKFARFPGTDGKRMSKSLGNTIEIRATPEEIRQKIRPAFTDPARLRRSDPGNPEICAIYTWYQKFMPGGRRDHGHRMPERRSRLRGLQEDADRRRQRIFRAPAGAPAGYEADPAT